MQAEASVAATTAAVAAAAAAAVVASVALTTSLDQHSQKPVVTRSSIVRQFSRVARRRFCGCSRCFFGTM